MDDKINLMNNKGASFLWVILGVLMAVGGSLLATRFLSGDEDTWVCQDGMWIEHGKPIRPMPSESCEMANEEGKMEKIGNLVRYDGDNFWTLVYEEPGAPALTIKLVFDGKSQCKMGLSLVSCDDNLWEAGARATVLGILDGESLVVSKLEIK